MSYTDYKQVSIAVLDMYEGHANQGMRCIREIITQWSKVNNIILRYDEFEVRRELQMPGVDYDIFISSGGPGSPLESEGSEWEANYFGWLQQVEAYNNNILNEVKKPVFFICHSFQLACRHYAIGNVCKRKSTSFGVFPVHMLEAGYQEPVFEYLKDPFYAVDSREYQVIEPDMERLQQMGGAVLCIEKERPHVPYQRAIMGVRFNDYFVGTQFHPEADATGMRMYLQREDKRKAVIEEYGEEKWSSMVEQLQHPDKILWTYEHILPNFLNQAIHESVLQ